MGERLAVGFETYTLARLKLIGKIRDKLGLYGSTNGKKHSYSSLSHLRGRPFVISVAPFDSKMSLFPNNEFINMVLLGMAPPVLEGPIRESREA